MTRKRRSCGREIREIENLYDEKTKLEAIVTGFKSNNEDYLDKIKQTVEEKVKDVLTNGKLLLKFATFSVIESLRSNPELYNFVIYDNSNDSPNSYACNYPSLMSHQDNSNNNHLIIVILI